MDRYFPFPTLARTLVIFPEVIVVEDSFSIRCLLPFSSNKACPLSHSTVIFEPRIPMSFT